MRAGDSKKRRRSMRLQGYDYSQAGIYFVTICVKNRECLFGEIKNEEMILNKLGRIVEKEWKKTPEKRKNVGLDEFIIMPNHLHGIIIINYKIVGIDCNQSLHKYGPQSNNLFAIIRGFKGSVTNQINLLSKNYSGGSIWQSRFYDHIIRNENSLEKIRSYIYNNPGGWRNDLENLVIDKNISEEQRKNYYKNIFNELE